MNEIIPFGKYKNQPIEALIGDKQYTEWLCQQNWFISQFSQLHTIIINNYNQPSETPEHNKMIARFLDDDLCKKLVLIIYKKYKKYSILKGIMDDIKEDIIRYSENRVDYNTHEKGTYRDEERSKVLLEEKKMDLEAFESRRGILINVNRKEFEANYDIHIEANIKIFINNKCYYNELEYIRLECKPILSEDFPAVLRQCKTQKANVLVIDQFDCESITFEQVKLIFGEIKVFKLSELTEQVL